MNSTTLLAALTLMIAVLAGPSFAGPTITIGANVPPEKRIPAEQIDHAAWDALLKKYVDDQGLVDYRAWKANLSDRRELEQYLAHLSSATFPAQTSAATKLAFWINAYNAVTVEGILREYPTTSIRNHTAKVFGYNIWKDLQLIVDGKPYSLDQMEHEVLRKMDEPLIHFAIVCASIGCPRLLNEAYIPSKLDEQLIANTQSFFADPTKFRFDASRKVITVSPILDWFGEDFGGTTAERLRRIAPFLPQAARELANSGTARLTFLDYDWGLNDQVESDR